MILHCFAEPLVFDFLHYFARLGMLPELASPARLMGEENRIALPRLRQVVASPAASKTVSFLGKRRLERFIFTPLLLRTDALRGRS